VNGHRSWRLVKFTHIDENKIISGPLVLEAAVVLAALLQLQ
jgi:hypothetical protein